MDAQLITVPFHGANLTLIDHNGVPYAAMKPIVEAMGMAWQSQHVKITERFGSVITEIVTTGADGKNYAMTCMPLRKLPGWLMTIHPKKLQPEIREKVIAYQNECDDALWDYWTKGQATKPSAPQPAAPLALPKPAIKTRDDLSFVRRDAKGRFINWSVPHDPEGDWHEGQEVGKQHFAEVVELADHSELEAFGAIRWALSGSEDFQRGFGTEFSNNGWGIEDGFAYAIARAVIDGLRARKGGQESFDPKGGDKKRGRPALPKPKHGALPCSQMPSPSMALLKERHHPIQPVSAGFFTPPRYGWRSVGDGAVG